MEIQATLLRADGDTIGHRTAQDLGHGIGIFCRVEIQPACCTGCRSANAAVMGTKRKPLAERHKIWLIRHAVSLRRKRINNPSIVNKLGGLTSANFSRSASPVVKNSESSYPHQGFYVFYTGIYD